MERRLEPELMDDADQAAAYARADFAGVNQGFVDRFRGLFPEFARGTVLDLGCGPADIPVRMARTLPGTRIVAIDGSAAMLGWGHRAVADSAVASQVDLVCCRVPSVPFAPATFDAVISNSLLHHLPDPRVFWEAISAYGRSGAPFLVMDLFRPDSPERAREIVEAGAANEAEILKHDFYYSLLAAFSLDEVRAQLPPSLRDVRCEIVSERHWVAWGRIG